MKRDTDQTNLFIFLTKASLNKFWVTFFISFPVLNITLTSKPLCTMAEYFYSHYTIHTPLSDNDIESLLSSTVSNLFVWNFASRRSLSLIAKKLFEMGRRTFVYTGISYTEVTGLSYTRIAVIYLLEFRILKNWTFVYEWFVHWNFVYWNTGLLLMPELSTGISYTRKRTKNCNIDPDVRLTFSYETFYRL